MTLDCPVCTRAQVSSICPQCGTDLTPLLHLAELRREVEALHRKRTNVGQAGSLRAGSQPAQTRTRERRPRGN